MKSTFALKLFSKEHVHTCNNPSQNLSEQSVMNKFHHYSFKLCFSRQIKVWVRIHTERTKTLTDKSLQRNLLIISQSFLLKIKTFYYFQNTWTNLLITYWKKKYFHYIFPNVKLLERNGGLHFLQVVERKKNVLTPIF